MLARRGLIRGGYVLFLSRLTRAKGVGELITGFAASRTGRRPQRWSSPATGRTPSNCITVARRLRSGGQDHLRPRRGRRGEAVPDGRVRGLRAAEQAGTRIHRDLRHRPGREDAGRRRAGDHHRDRRHRRGGRRLRDDHSASRIRRRSRPRWTRRCWTAHRSSVRPGAAGPDPRVCNSTGRRSSTRSSPGCQPNWPPPHSPAELGRLTSRDGPKPAVSSSSPCSVFSVRSTWGVPNEAPNPSFRQSRCARGRGASGVQVGVDVGRRGGRRRPARIEIELLVGQGGFWIVIAPADRALLERVARWFGSSPQPGRASCLVRHALRLW